MYSLYIPNNLEYTRKQCSDLKGEKAEIVICGLGFFKLFINGRKVSEDLLVPNATCYSERDLMKLTFKIYDELSYRIYCMKYDPRIKLVSQSYPGIFVLLWCFK